MMPIGREWKGRSGIIVHGFWDLFDLDGINFPGAFNANMIFDIIG